MKKALLQKFIKSSVTFIIVIGTIYQAFTNNASVPVSRTNADPSNCGSCHGGSTATKSMTLTGIPATGWKNDSTYTLTLTSKMSQKLGGFQITVLDKTKKGTYGTLSIGTGSGTKKQTNAGSKRDYIAHSKGKSVSGGTVSWTFDWKAPKTGSDTITFYPIINDANSDGSDGGDDIYYQTFTFNPNIAKSGTAPTAIFKVSNSKICEGDSVNITDLSIDSPASWTYSSVLLKKTSTLQNPTFNYTKGFTGQDTIKLLAVNKYGSSTYSVPVSVSAAPDTIITQKGKPVSSVVICKGDTAVLVGPSGSAWKWSNGTSNQSVLLTSAGTYTVSTLNSGGCSSISTVKVSIGSAPSAPKINLFQDSICLGNSGTINIPVPTSSYTKSYLYENGKLVSSNIPGNIIVKPSTSTKYSVVLENGCASPSSNIVSLTVVTLTKPTLSSTKEFCDGDLMTLIGNYDTKTSSIDVNQGSKSLYSGKPIKVISAGKADITNKDTIYLTANNFSLNCSIKSAGFVPVINPKPTIKFTVSQKGLKATFANTSTNAKSYIWSFGDKKADTAKSPVHSYPKLGTYKITLTAISNKLCSVTDSSTLVLTSISDNSFATDLGFKIAPNPATNKLTIFGNQTKNISLNIYSLTGKVYNQISNFKENEISLELLPAGMYYISISNEDGRQIIPFVKE